MVNYSTGATADGGVKIVLPSAPMTDLIPDEDNTRVVGTSSKRWRDGQFVTLKVGADPVDVHAQLGSLIDGSLAVNARVDGVDAQLVDILTNEGLVESEITELKVNVIAVGNDITNILSSIVTETNDRLAEVADERTRVDALRVESDDLWAKVGQPGGIIILDGAGKLPMAHLPLTTLVYCGTWNAATNYPPIASSHSPMGAGCYRIVSVAGNTLIDGESLWAVKDWIIWNGTVWSKVDNTESVTAVNGLQGSVDLQLGTLSDVTVSSIDAGEILAYDGSNWVNRTIGEAGLLTANNANLTGTTNVANLRVGSDAIRLGLAAGLTNQGTNTVAIGGNAGQFNQAPNAISVGLEAGNSGQGQNAVAIGRSAGSITQGGFGVAVGYGAGYSNQSAYSVAIGNDAGETDQKASAVAIGNSAGQNSQGTNSVAIGTSAGTTSQAAQSVAIGVNAGRINQQPSAVAIGPSAGDNTQASNCVAIGNGAGAVGQLADAVAIGADAGRTTQGGNSVAIGADAGETNQGANSVAIGNEAGKTNQNGTAVAIGSFAGRSGQMAGAVAIGSYAGYADQLGNSVAMGPEAGYSNQGACSVAIGYRAGYSSQHNLTTIINATASALNSDIANALFIKPIRPAPNTYFLKYNIGNGEITYSL